MKRIKLHDFWTVGEDFEKRYDAEAEALEAAGGDRSKLIHHDAQKRFVNSDSRAAAYIGGLGSGKTFAGIARGLKFSQQPIAEDTLFGPRGCIAAINYPVLKDVVLPQFFEMMEGGGLWKTGRQSSSWVRSELKARLVANCSCVDRHLCKHETHILFRSLDKPNWMRGLELTWFFIDEGRHVTGEAWDVLYARLRQLGYEHAGWVCSTPNGYDWMWEKFHPDSPDEIRLKGAIWFGASTMANRANLPQPYIESLFATYEGAFLRQEVFGEFVGITQGAVFFAFRPLEALQEVPYREDLELHSMWDFGIGDLNAVLFGQVDWQEKILPDKSKTYVPVARMVGLMEATDRTSGQWAFEFNRWCDEHYGGRRPSMNVGDPAGLQRNQVTGTSVIDDLASHGVTVIPAPRRAPDQGFRILNNMMEGNRVLVDREHCGRLGAALASYHWPVDPAGNRTGTKPVHDWTSHFCDAMRYWSLIVFNLFPRREKALTKPPPGPGTIGDIVRQITAPVGDWLGAPKERQINWQPGPIRPRSVARG